MAENVPQTVTYSIHGGRPFVVTADYVVDAQLGSGGFGVVCSGTHKLTGERVAIKQLFLDGRVMSAIRLLREIRALKYFDHENIVTLYDILEIADPAFREIYLVMDHMDCDLATVIGTGTLSPMHIRSFMYQLLRGVKCIHSAGMIHRDIKPKNLLVTKDCDLKICDFGLARELSDEGGMTVYVETRWYRAPEIVMQSKTYGQEIDMWSIGCTLAEMVLRRPIWVGRDAKHQIDLILQTLGAPTAEEVEGVGDPKAQQYCVEAVRRWGREGLSAQFFGSFEPEAAALLRQLLVFSPRARADVHAALESPFVQPFRNAADEPTVEPKCDSDFGAEGDLRETELDFVQVRAMLYEEMLFFHPAKREPQPAVTLEVGAVGGELAPRSEVVSPGGSSGSDEIGASLSPPHWGGGRSPDAWATPGAVSGASCPGTAARWAALPCGAE